MLLHSLLQQLKVTGDVSALPNVEVSRVIEDSRHVQPGDLFIARTGLKKDGATFLADAAARGAVAAVVANKLVAPPLPTFVVADPNRAASLLGNHLAGDPSHAVKVVGVTGTNGKTTTTYLIRHLLAHANRRCGMIGTVEIDDGDTRSEATMTTPGAIDVARLLGTMRDNRCDGCAIEVSSHALDQHRVAGVKFAAAGFTNLTQDHLDYHGNMADYASAKARLFEMLDENTVAVVNADDPWSERMIQASAARLIRFGLGKSADYRARDVSVTSQGSRFILHTPDGNAEVSMPMIGKHNVENALCAAALAGETFGLSVHQIAAGLHDAHGAPGRLQIVRAGQRFGVFVDYAHTDDGLINVLRALRPLTRGKLRVLFGCGGDRDRTKRPKMAKACEELADEIYVTSDNPRTEHPAAIIAEIIKGFRSNDRVRVEPDRRAAIGMIIADASPDDVVLLAGKGHENYQIVGTTKYHFDDVEEATNALTNLV